MLAPELILSLAKDPDRRIGIGAAADLTKVRASVTRANAARYGSSAIYRDPGEMVRDLKRGELDAVVRGSLDSNSVMGAVRREFSVEGVQRMALLQPRKGPMFFLAPVGVDEGWTAEQRFELAKNGARLMRRLGEEPRIGFLSGGRRGDKGRHPAVDRTLEETAALVQRCLAIGIEAVDHEILIEEAARDCNMIIAPDGVSGNLVFRTLHFLGEGRALGAPIINIDRVFVDTSRAKGSYLDSIALASALVGVRQ
jgi:putative methanogen marker protein 4